MLWIVSGPTSVGKSTFLMSHRCSEITDLPSETPLVFPDDLLALGSAENDTLATSHAFYHYNIMRPLQLFRRERRVREGRAHPPTGVRTVAGPQDFRGDPGWTGLAHLEVEKRAVVLVADKKTLLNRVADRETYESLADADDGRTYNRRRWLKLYERLDLASLYQSWCDELRSRGISYVLVDARDGSYPVIGNEETMLEAVDGGSPGRRGNYGKEEIEEILRERRFEYHKIDLPYGLSTGGQDRRDTLDLVFPRHLEGESVLDVGSALGYFCFEAEVRGAARVVGVELKASRYRDALLLKDIKDSKVEFVRRDILEDPMEESFDHVLLLNVIHHLTEPARAMRQLARMVRRRMVIEFPTFSDQKFRRTGRFGPSWLYNRLPIIGVSSALKEQQTFVFAPPAIRRILTDHEKLFERVEILRSPMPGRAIAICHKGPSPG